MGWGWHPRRQRREPVRAPWLAAIWLGGIILMVVLVAGVAGAETPWPLFIIFFWFGAPFLRRTHRDETHSATSVKAKRKNDDRDETDKPKRDLARSPGYLVTEDGDVVEVVAPPDDTARERRHR